MRYRVVSAYAEDPTVAEQGNPYGPIVRPRWFSVLGNAVFATSSRARNTCPIRPRAPVSGTSLRSAR